MHPSRPSKGATCFWKSGAAWVFRFANRCDAGGARLGQRDADQDFVFRLFILYWTNRDKTTMATAPTKENSISS